MAKIDFKKTEKQFYAPKKNPETIVIPAMKFLMVDGHGDPNTSQEYTDSINALYSVSYTLKFHLKKKGVGPDYTVPPLEGLWWTDDMKTFSVDRKDEWLWTSMIRQPDHISIKDVSEAIEQVRGKKNPTMLDAVRFETYNEGLVVQVMYVGPYADEGPTIERLHQFAFDQGYQLRGKHHEIYLGDPRRTKPENLKTVIRQPITK